MTDGRLDLLAPKPLTIEEIYRVIGALYLELDVLRRQVQTVRASLETSPPTDHPLMRD